MINSKFSKEQVENACKNSNSSREVSLKLNCSISYAVALFRKYNIKPDFIQIGVKPKYTKEVLEEMCKRSNTLKEVAIKLNYSSFTNLSYLSSLIIKYKIDFVNNQKLGIPVKYTKEILEEACKGAETLEVVMERLGLNPKRTTYIKSFLKEYNLPIPPGLSKIGRPNLKNTTTSRKIKREKNKIKRNNLFEKTNFLEIYYDKIPHKQRGWHYNRNIFDFIKCKCGNYSTFNGKNYDMYCSKKCFKKYQTISTKETCLIKYGVDNYNKLDFVRKKHGDRILNQMINGIYKHSYKNYILPSGRIIRIQGFEDKALNILLTKYREDDILYGPKEIHQITGIIKYKFEDQERKYFPDFYIKSENKIIEVKSIWTFDKKGRSKKLREQNELKKEACIKKGLNFEFMIL